MKQIEASAAFLNQENQLDFDLSNGYERGQGHSSFADVSIFHCQSSVFIYEEAME